VSSSEPSPDERRLDELGHEHAGRGESEPAAWAFLGGAHLAFARGDHAAARRFHTLAVHAARAVVQLARPALIPSLLLLESELAAEAGHARVAADLQVRAIAGFTAVGDRDGVIAVWTARAERALRAGNVEAAHGIAATLLPALDARGDREAGIWLRVRLGAALAGARRVDEAVPLLGAAYDLTAPGSGERMAIAAEAMRICLDDGRLRDAVAIAVRDLDEPARGARQLHAEVLVLAAVALVRLGEHEEAARFEARAAGFDSPGLAEARRRLVAARG
jgi:hypothetical protein